MKEPKSYLHWAVEEYADKQDSDLMIFCIYTAAKVNFLVHSNGVDVKMKAPRQSLSWIICIESQNCMTESVLSHDMDVIQASTVRDVVRQKLVLDKE